MRGLKRSDGLWVHREDIEYLGESLEDVKSFMLNTGYSREEVALAIQENVVSSIRGWSKSTFPNTATEVGPGDVVFLSWTTLFELGNCIYRLVLQKNCGSGIGPVMWAFIS